MLHRAERRFGGTLLDLRRLVVQARKVHGGMPRYDGDAVCRYGNAVAHDTYCRIGHIWNLKGEHA